MAFLWDVAPLLAVYAHDAEAEVPNAGHGLPLLEVHHPELKLTLTSNLVKLLD